MKFKKALNESEQLIQGLPDQLAYDPLNTEREVDTTFKLNTYNGSFTNSIDSRGNQDLLVYERNLNQSLSSRAETLMYIIPKDPFIGLKRMWIKFSPPLHTWQTVANSDSGSC